MRKQSLLRIECEFTLSSIRNDFFVGISFLWRQPPLHRLLQALNKLGIPQGPPCVRALTNEGEPVRDEAARDKVLELEQRQYLG